MRKRLNVKNFGAVMNGKTDDSAAFQAAIDEAIRIGGIVYVPRGIIRVKAKLNARGVRLVGAGRTATHVRPD